MVFVSWCCSIYFTVSETAITIAAIYIAHESLRLQSYGQLHSYNVKRGRACCGSVELALNNCSTQAYRPGGNGCVGDVEQTFRHIEYILFYHMCFIVVCVRMVDVTPLNGLVLPPKLRRYLLRRIRLGLISLAAFDPRCRKL